MNTNYSHLIRSFRSFVLRHLLVLPNLDCDQFSTARFHICPVSALISLAKRYGSRLNVLSIVIPASNYCLLPVPGTNRRNFVTAADSHICISHVIEVEVIVLELVRNPTNDANWPLRSAISEVNVDTRQD